MRVAAEVAAAKKAKEEKEAAAALKAKLEEEARIAAETAAV